MSQTEGKWLTGRGSCEYKVGFAEKPGAQKVCLNLASRNLLTFLLIIVSYHLKLVYVHVGSFLLAHEGRETGQLQFV